MASALAPHSQENYLNYQPTIARDEASQLRCLAKAAGCLAEGDVLNTAVYRGQNWGLMPAMQAVGVAMPAAYMRCGGQAGVPCCGAWLGGA